MILFSSYDTNNGILFSFLLTLLILMILSNPHGNRNIEVRNKRTWMRKRLLREYVCNFVVLTWRPSKAHGIHIIMVITAIFCICKAAIKFSKIKKEILKREVWNLLMFQFSNMFRTISEYLQVFKWKLELSSMNYQMNHCNFGC